MAKNVTMEQSIYQLLKDVDRNYFTSNRQLNKDSMLYQTVEQVQDKNLFKDLKIEEIKNYPLASVSLKEASLTDNGKNKLKELKKKFENTEE